MGMPCVSRSGTACPFTDGRPLEGSLLSVVPSHVTVTSICPSQDGRHVILQVRETAGCDGVEFSLVSRGKKLRFDRVDALETVLESRLLSCPIPAGGDLFIRVRYPV